MRRKKRLLAIAALAVAGLGWLAWKRGPEPAARYAFEFDAIVDSEWGAFRSAVGCYPFEAEFMGKTRIYGLRERLFAKELKSGRTFYVAVPNACSYAVNGEHLPQSDRERPAFDEARAVTPLTFV